MMRPCDLEAHVGRGQKGRALAPGRRPPNRLKTAHDRGKIEKWRKSSLGNSNRSRADRRAVGPLAGETDPMSDAQTHFVAVCPHCAAQLKIRRVYLGQAVR